jgi:carboxyl-terminal processing protease
VAACLQDNKRAGVIGERTWGKGSVQNVIELEDGRSALKLTTAAYRRPNGKNIHRFPDAKPKDEWGVMPDANLEVRLTDAEILALNKDRRTRDIVHPVVQNVPATKEPSKNEQAKTPAVVDRQLQAAMKYLNTELAKAP